jgi:hypothetical protein
MINRRYKSFDRVIYPAIASFRFAFLSAIGIYPGFRKFLYGFYEKFAFGHPGGFKNKEMTLKAYHAWNERVHAVIPADRLLVFKVTEGWDPLCKFLGVPKPSEPFPHANDTESLVAGRRASSRAANLLMAIIALVISWIARRLGLSKPLAVLIFSPAVVAALLPIDW